MSSKAKTMDNQKELFVVVNKNDVVMGYKSRYDCHHNNILIHRAAGTAVFNSKGELLLLKRSKTKDLGAGLWDVSSAGHVNKNESYEQTAKRELFEELGIDSPLAFHSKTFFSDANESEMCVLFTTTYNGTYTVNKEEIEEIMFIHPDILAEKVRVKEIQLSQWAKQDVKKLLIL